MIKNIDKKVIVSIYEYGSIRVRIELKTKEVFNKLLDSWVFDNIQIELKKSYSEKNRWIILIPILNMDLIDDLKNLGCTINDLR